MSLPELAGLVDVLPKPTAVTKVTQFFDLTVDDNVEPETEPQGYTPGSDGKVGLRAHAEHCENLHSCAFLVVNVGKASLQAHAGQCENLHSSATFAYDLVVENFGKVQYYMEFTSWCYIGS